MNDPVHLDALVVDADFGGIYQLYSLLKLGSSYLYRYSWDKDDLQTYPWSNNYLTGEEVGRYLNHVVDRHRLREHFHFSIEMVSAEWHEPTRRWRVLVSTGAVFITSYLFTALGIQSTPNIPTFPGLNTFRGPIMHSSAWDPAVSVSDKRVGIIGCGSSGIQLSNAIAPQVGELRVFIRNPQFSIPLGLRPVTDAMRSDINARYDDIWAAQRVSRTAFGFKEPTTRMASVTSEEREHVFEELWNAGNGFRFMFGGFEDICSDVRANEEACQFLRRKIAAIVKDPATAAVLTPRELFAQRPPSDEGYFDKFNLDNVLAVDIRKTPITAVEAGGVRTADGHLHELDILILATGFQSSDGSYKALRGGIRGRGGVELGDYWAGELRTYLSMFVPSFPNLFLVNGPQGPFSNAPTLIEAQVDFLTTMIAELREAGAMRTVVKCTAQAETKWVALCNEVAASETLFHKVDSWLTRKNTSSVKNSTKFFYGGLKKFREYLQDVKEGNYRGLSISS